MITKLHEHITNRKNKDDDKVVEDFIKKGGDINEKDVYGNTPLMDAVNFGKVFIAKALIKAGANVNVANIGGNTPLGSAAKVCSKLVSPLLKAGAFIDARSKFGSSALSHAVYDGDCPTALLLLKAGADVNTQDNRGESPLLRALVHGHTKMVKLLLKYGANPTVVSVDGCGALDCTDDTDKKTRDLLKRAIANQLKKQGSVIKGSGQEVDV